MKVRALIVTATILLSATAAQGQTIRATDFEVSYPAENKVKFTLAAEAEGDVQINSYCVRLNRSQPWVSTLPGVTFVKANYAYVPSDDVGDEPSAYLLDNGAHDEDSRRGVFAITLDTSEWPDGRYEFLVAAMNRPGIGTYTDAHELTVLEIGDAPDEFDRANVEGAEHGVIYQKDGIYACFPSLMALEDGRLVTTFGTRTRPSHIDFTGGTKTMITADGGTTWTEFSGPVINPQWKTADGSLVQADADGWVYAPAEQREQLEQEKRYIHDVRPGTIAYLGGAHYRVSEDGGKTWKTHRIPMPDHIAGLMHYHDDTSSVATADGVRLTAVYGPHKSTRRFGVYFLRSEDDGQTWNLVPLLPDGQDIPENDFNETALVELPDGRILAMIRSEPAAHLYRSISEDKGKTWSTPEKTDIWGYPADLLVLPDGRVLCIYGYRRSPMGIRATLSNDGGETWDVENEMILRADAQGIPEDIGYPRVVQLPDGQLLAVYYIDADEASKRVHVAWTRWNIPASNTVR